MATAYDLRFLELERHISDPMGFPWDRLREVRARLPSEPNVNLWLLQIALLVPLLLIAAGVLELRRRGPHGGDASNAWPMVVAGVFLALVHSALFRQPSYVVVTAPLSAALGARFLAGRVMVGRACAVIVLVLTTCAAVMWARRTPIFLVSELGASMSTGFDQLLASPPVEGEPRYRYLYECTAPGDRVLITGATPSLVGYYANRPFAGGHTYWHHGWLSDPTSEARSLDLLQRQSVPFVVSTHDPVMTDFKQYPRIHEYLETHYVALEGTYGTTLVDTRRRPAGRFGPLGYPCFR